MSATSLLWFRLDLRLADNPALEAARARGGPVVPVFIWAPEEEAPWAPGAASRWWLHQSLASLNASLNACGSGLVLRRGATLETLLALARECRADSVFWNRRYEPAVVARDANIQDALQRAGLEGRGFNAALLHEPWTIQNQGGNPFQVFTPFWRHVLSKPDPAEPPGAPRKLPAPKPWPPSLPLDALELEPKLNWAAGMKANWQPGEAGARARLRRFLADAFPRYGEDRNRPDLAGTSRLSPHLHFGEIGPRQVWHALSRHAEADGIPVSQWRTSQYVAELGWREFAHHLLHHFPHTPGEPLRADFKRFPWNPNPAWLAAWRRGRTGYPIVDAALRELWATGWMHNRARMIVASFLVKDLLIPWQEGARWFWDTLVDADLAQNTLGWQWSAGCGADAAPYFRVFNPVSQGEKFDPDGRYVRRWCPELAKLPNKWLHQPFAAPPNVLDAAGVQAGRTHPRPLVNHAIARNVALEAFARIKRKL